MVLVIGASSAIAKALISLYSAKQTVVAVSRKTKIHEEKNVIHVKSDYSEDIIDKTSSHIIDTYGIPSLVFICIGTLHSDKYFPEKKLEDITGEYLEYTQQVNFVIPSLWLTRLCAKLPRTSNTTMTAFSARVGSIEDNRLGGWYAYRASKSALNMFIQTLSIEMARRAKNVKLVAFHPGTTDTPLSKPFQARVPQGKLFTPKFVAEQLAHIVNSLPSHNTAQFIDWQGKTIPW